ncbi:class I SAM-dependent methyltransferase family protein [Actinoplanes awajinensis]|uniref:Methyltransferase n=1 Tax=Actinoplanes awajinensis subsp. mycoplanecinus TaxID=135947 RepID=A0A117MME0_9ACTN|nr:class I SAM-dependent methyltransferase family protein [Actinoplanes awajinensis]KUL25329.1 methyltransferase [Actinoplanes awajinensis subsp. mycoplanecinus]
MSTDWSEWHDAYARPNAALGNRLAAVRDQIERYMDATTSDPVRVISACAGDGRDLLGVLAGRKDADRVSALLVEYDARLAARAGEAAAALPSAVEVVQADAAHSDIYAHAVPANLVLLCGIFGNISDADVRTTIEAVPELCAPGAEVVWTRHRREPDLTPSIRGWFADSGFEEVAFVAPEDELWSVGVHRLVTTPRPLEFGRHWFTFLR